MVFYVTGRWFLLSTAPKGWANVFADEGGTYDRFGYNVPEDRWVTASSRQEASTIRRAIVDAANR